MRRTVLVLVATLVVASGVALAVVREGGPGNDLLIGTWSSDTLEGKGSNDTLVGLAGGDWLLGDGGNEALCRLGGREERATSLRSGTAGRSRAALRRIVVRSSQGSS
jgi:Ca2+-binding RTX toxin-like protein